MKRSVFGNVHAKITQNIEAKKALQKIPLIKLFYTSLIINIVSIAGIIVLKNNLPPEVPLFYGLPQGADQLSSKMGLIIPGIFSTTVVLINVLIAMLLKNEFLKKALIITGFSISFLSLVTTFQVVFLVGNI